MEVDARPYLPLEIQKNEIRVLHLDPGKDDDRICIRLQHIRPGFMEQYEALSYVWGTASSMQTVRVNGTHDLTITENLDLVLRHLRLLKRSRVLWIDAVCINQSDLEERRQQVQMMGIIYSKAHEVIIWLGADHGYDYHNLLLHMDRLKEPKSNASYIRLLREWCQLGSSPWFSRLWVVQELVLASNDPMVYIGRYRIRWSILSSGSQYLYDLFMSPPQELNELEDDKLLRDFMIYSQDFLTFRYHRLKGRKAPFKARLYDTEFAQATDPRDKIYGVLAMSEFVGSPLQPDYTLTIQEVLIQTTAILLRDHWPMVYSIYPLHYMRDEDSPRIKTVPNLPSWVPDMTLQSKLNREELDEQDQYWKPRNLLRLDPDFLGELCNELPRSVPIAQLPQICTSLIATGHTLGRLIWTSRPNYFQGPDAAMRLNALYHGTLKQNGFTIPMFYRALHESYEDYHFFQHMWAFEEFLGEQNMSAEDISFHYQDALEPVLRGADNRTLFITDSGHIGQTYHPNPDGVRQGDILVGLFGINFPFVIHPLDHQKFRMINVAHVVDHEWGCKARIMNETRSPLQQCTSQEYEFL
jgi:hypothetical protein